MRVRTSSAFTIVELLIVIIVIAILAAITIVSYNGITERTVIAAISSDLKNSATKLEMGRAENGSYNEDQSSLPKSPDTSYQFTVDNAQNPPYYCLTAISSKSNKLVYHISSTEGKPISGACPGDHGPIAYTFDFTLTGNPSTSLSSVNYAFSWDNSTISALQYQEYWLYSSCTGPGIIAAPEPNNPRTATGSGSATTSLGWNVSPISMSHSTTAALWVRVRPVDSGGNALTDWSQAKGVVGNQGSWSACSTSQSPWQTTPTITATINNATVSNIASSPNMQASITHSAVTTAPVYYRGASDFTATNYRLSYEKVVYLDSGCVGSSPSIPTRDNDTGTPSFTISSAVAGTSLSNMRVSLPVANPPVGAVWARVRVETSTGSPLSDWSAPYGVLTVYNLSTTPKQVTVQTCSTTTLPASSHWPSAR